MKGRQESRGPQIISRYNPKVERVRIEGKEEEHILIHGYVAEEGHKVNLVIQPPSREQLDAQQQEPVKIRFDAWLYRDRWVQIQDTSRYLDDEAALLVKRAVLREERGLAQARQEVEALERFGDLPTASRETIPDEVRLFVWQRDGGSCVRCGSREKLEFDHIIPVADGGSSTERNVQLLCEPCNRTKGRSVI